MRAVALLLLCLLGAPTRAQNEFVQEVKRPTTLNHLDVDAPDAAGPTHPPPVPAAAPPPKATPTPTATAAPVETPTFSVTEEGQRAFFDKWQKRAEVVRAHDLVRARRLLATLDDALLDAGIQGTPLGYRATAASESLVTEALVAVEAHQFEDAGLLLETATRADPQNAHAHAAKALLAARESAYSDALSHFIEAGRVFVAEPSGQAIITVRALLLLAGTLATMLFALTFLVAIPALRYLAFDIENRLPRGAHPLQLRVLVLVLAVTPVLLGAGPILSAALVLVMAYLFVPSSARVAVPVVFGLFALAPPLLEPWSRAVAYDGSREARAERALRHFDAADDRHALQQLPPATLNASERAALGMFAKREGRLDEARTQLQAAVALVRDSDTELAYVHANLGVVEALLHHEDAALAEFTKALSMDKTLAAAAFNAAAIHLRRSRVEKAETFNKMLQAQEADQSNFRRITYRLADQNVNHNRVFIDAMPVPAHAISDVVDSAASDAIAAEVADVAWFGWRGWSASLLFVGLAFLCVVLGVLRKHLTPSQACDRCGAPASAVRAQQGEASACAQCFHAFLSTKSRIDAAAKLKKEAEIVRHRRVLSVSVWLLDVVLPGAGHLWAGAALRGTLFIGIAGALVGWVLLSLGAWPGVQLTFAPVQNGLLGFGIGGASLLWLVTCVSTFGVVADLRRKG